VAVLRYSQQATKEDWMAKKASDGPRRSYRSTKTGRYVTKKFAKKHPKSTIKEKNPLSTSSVER